MIENPYSSNHNCSRKSKFWIMSALTINYDKTAQDTPSYIARSTVFASNSSNAITE